MRQAERWTVFFLSLCLFVGLSFCRPGDLPAAPRLPRADRYHGPIEVPLVGQPPYYWDAVGTRFEVRMRSTRTAMYVGQSLVLTVRVTAVGPYHQPPQRPRLDEVPRFRERFKIDWVNKDKAGLSGKPDRVLADQRAWEFDYLLRPVNDQVQRIPPLPFVWYRPHRNPNLRGSFQTTYDEGIDLQVKPVPSESINVVQKPIQVPEAFFQIATGADVLRREQVFALPSASLLALLIVAPPTLGAAWCVLWRRLYPDAARLARRRQSRAALVALRTLKSLGAVSGRKRVERITALAADYLRQRLDLPTVEPTPAEVANHLARAGASPDSIKQATDFFQACDAARFAPVPLEEQVDLASAIQQLIVTLEAETWSQRS